MTRYARRADWLAEQPGWHVQGVTESPITGAEGNREFLIAGRICRPERSEGTTPPSPAPTLSQAPLMAPHAARKPREPELVVVGQGLEQREVGLQQGLVGQATIGHQYRRPRACAPCRRFDHGLAERRRGRPGWCETADCRRWCHRPRALALAGKSLAGGTLPAGGRRHWPAPPRARGARHRSDRDGRCLASPAAVGQAEIAPAASEVRDEKRDRPADGAASKAEPSSILFFQLKMQGWLPRDLPSAAGAVNCNANSPAVSGRAS